MYKMPYKYTQGGNKEEINKWLKSEQTDKDNLSPYIKFAVEQAMRHLH